MLFHGKCIISSMTLRKHTLFYCWISSPWNNYCCLKVLSGLRRVTEINFYPSGGLKRTRRRRGVATEVVWFFGVEFSIFPLCRATGVGHVVLAFDIYFFFNTLLDRGAVTRAKQYLLNTSPQRSLRAFNKIQEFDAESFFYKSNSTERLETLSRGRTRSVTAIIRSADAHHGYNIIIHVRHGREEYGSPSGIMIYTTHFYACNARRYELYAVRLCARAVDDGVTMFLAI